MKIKILLVIFTFIFSLGLIAAPATHYVSAALNDTSVSGVNDTSVKNTADVVALPNPLPVSTPQALIGRVINAVLGIIGSIALLMFIYGGLLWMTSAGNSDQVKKGREIFIWASIGLLIIFISYAAVRFVITEVLGA